MARWPYTDDDLRAMYAGGRGNNTARRFARVWAGVLGAGLLPRRWVTLEVTGRRTGRPTRFPLGMADWQGRWYLVSMLGEHCNWVRNVRAADGLVTIRHGRARPRRLVEVPAAERAPILKRYLEKVPGARPHLPIDRAAPLSEFEAIADRYPVFRVDLPAPVDRPQRKRRWLRWTVAGTIALVLLLVAAVAAAIKLQPTPAPLALPASVAPPAGSLDGTWSITSGSVAGFRIQQTVIGLTSDVVGRTGDLTGTVTVDRGQITAAHVRINLLALTSGGKPAPQFAASLDTSQYPDATVDLAGPVALAPGFTTGHLATVNAAGRLTLHGTTHTVTVPMSMRRDGTGVEVTGTLPVTFADWAIARPAGYGWFGSLADHGTAEFLIVLRRS